jgi:SnoaL-like protein
MADATTLIDTYMATWNEKDPARRRALIAETFTDDADYLDPLMHGEGPAGIDAMIAGVQQQYADYRFELAAQPDAHNDRVRFSWHLVAIRGGQAVATGYDFGILAEDGRLRSVTGFLETTPH